MATCKDCKREGCRKLERPENALDSLDCERAAHARTRAELAGVRERLADLQRAWPQDPQYVNATPDPSYPERILEAHIDHSIADGNMGGEVLAKLMNEAQAERNAILRRAIAALAAARKETP